VRVALVRVLARVQDAFRVAPAGVQRFSSVRVAPAVRDGAVELLGVRSSIARVGPGVLAAAAVGQRAVERGVRPRIEQRPVLGLRVLEPSTPAASAPPSSSGIVSDPPQAAANAAPNAESATAKGKSLRFRPMNMLLKSLRESERARARFATATAPSFRG
jgi:hypothetical protein